MSGALEVVMLAFGYGVTAVISFRIFRWAWLADFDYRRSDRAFCIALSAGGPLSLIVACIIGAITWAGELDGASEVLERRPERSTR